MSSRPITMLRHTAHFVHDVVGLSRAFLFVIMYFMLLGSALIVYEGANKIGVSQSDKYFPDPASLLSVIFPPCHSIHDNIVFNVVFVKRMFYTCIFLWYKRASKLPCVKRTQFDDSLYSLCCHRASHFVFLLSAPKRKFALIKSLSRSKPFRSESEFLLPRIRRWS